MTEAERAARDINMAGISAEWDRAVLGGPSFRSVHDLHYAAPGKPGRRRGEGPGRNPDLTVDEHRYRLTEAWKDAKRTWGNRPPPGRLIAKKYQQGSRVWATIRRAIARDGYDPDRYRRTGEMVKRNLDS